MGKPPANELACGGRGETGRRGSSGACYLDADRTYGSEAVLSRHREQRGRRRAAGVRSATADQFVGICLQPRDRFSAGSGAALRVRSRIPVVGGVAGGELPHAGGLSRGETEGVG